MMTKGAVASRDTPVALPADPSGSPPRADEAAGSDLRYYLADVVVRTLGTAFTFVALPMIALIHLGATVVEMSILVAAGTAPSVVTSLLGGALVDRYRRLPLLFLGRAAGAVALAAVPLAAVAGVLSMPLLCGVALLVAAVNDIAGTAQVSYLPVLVGRRHLEAANARVWVQWACAQAAGKNIAVGLVAFVGAGWTIAADVVAYLLSAACITRYRTAEPEPEPEPRAHGSTLWGEIRSGLHDTRADPVVWRLLLCTSAMRVSLTAGDTLLLVILVQHLHYSAVAVGVVAGCGGIGGIVGALCAGRWPPGPRMRGALAILPLAMLPVLAAGPGLVWLLVTGAAVAVWTGAAIAVESTTRFVCQFLCSEEFQGRRQSIANWIILVPCAAAALSAGQLGDLLGLKPAMALAAFCAAIPAVLIRTPARLLPDRLTNIGTKAQ